MLVTVTNSGEFGGGGLNLKSRYFALIHPPRISLLKRSRLGPSSPDDDDDDDDDTSHPIKLILYSVGRRTPIYHVLTSYSGEHPLDNALELGGLGFKGVQVDKLRLHKYDSSNPNEVAAFLPRRRKKTGTRGQKGSGDICGINAERGLVVGSRGRSCQRGAKKDAKFLASSA
ncbi:hypothetical protein K0M31_000496 [Melipona bicolor]|uniref:Uncharacterized protein n=1 Tax=Melipona bicolor TaxID=60889 RepID=A0AA40GEF8_9HYME|nr:hypothetical protein K0M31_000496 [Melipona bicolor]